MAVKRTKLFIKMLTALIPLAVFSGVLCAGDDPCGTTLYVNSVPACNAAQDIGYICLYQSSIWTLYYTGGNYSFSGGSDNSVNAFYEDDEEPGPTYLVQLGSMGTQTGDQASVTFTISTIPGVPASTDCKDLYVQIPACSLTGSNETFAIVEGTPQPTCLVIATITPTEPPCQVITCAGQYDGMNPCQTCTVVATPTPSPTPSPSSTPSPSATPTPCSSCIGAGSITREPQGSGAAWANDTVPYNVPTVVTGTLPDGQKVTNQMKWIGCALTCLSMVDSGLNPGAMDTTMTAHPSPPAIDSSGGLDLQSAANYLHYTCSAPIPVSNSNSTAIVDALCNNSYVIAEVANGEDTHFVVITGQEINPHSMMCDFTIADPASADEEFLSAYGGAENIRILTAP